ncbi:MAG: MurR/RpiR family transcriptional regulator [Rhodobacteraceae bacterium]|nr:MurR/RpiR family transcriptional regulator [Paracoccaceae bacterium]
MTLSARIEDRISDSYSDLSAKLKEAADYVVAHQVDVAARSLRSVSAASGVSPATLSRLARMLGFETYEEMREMCRNAVGGRAMSFSERAERLKRDQDGATVLERQSSACVGNITDMAETLDRARLEATVEALAKARNVVLFGALSSTGIVEYMAYLANYFCTNWSLAGRMGASLGATLSSLDETDVLLIVTKAPYASRAVHAADLAREAGAKIVVLTDSHTCPALQHATFSFILPSDSPQFFSSYAATLVLVETVIAMLVARSGEDADQRIRDVEARNRRLGEFGAS